MRLVCSTLVGRDVEIQTLDAAVRAVRSRRGGVVLLVGEAGIGKTRLAREAEALATAAGLRRLRGRATATPIPYRPLSEALLSELRHRAAPAEPALAAYLPALSRLVPEWRTDRPPGADDSLVVLAEAVLRLLVHLGEDGGCLVVLEDLHDADADTLAVLEYLADNLAGEPVLLVGTLRAGSGPALALARDLELRRAATVVDVARLDDEAVRAMVAGCLGAAPDAVPAPVFERLRRDTAGVPFLIEELLAGMVAAGSLVRTGTGWQHRPPVEPEVPATLVHHMATRAARLGPRGQTLLYAAAVIGHRFSARVAGAVAGLTDDEALAHLRDAVADQLVVPGDDPDTYAFRHALTAEALRTRMLPAERADLARRAADAIDWCFPGLPGGWCQLAAELRLVAGDVIAAAKGFHTAGRRATMQGAVAAAVSMLERGLRLVDDAGGPDDLALGLAEALLDAFVVAGEVDRAVALGARLDARATPERRATVHLRLAKAHAAAGRWDDGLREVQRVRQLRGPDAGDDAPLDAVAARLALGNPTPDRIVVAERLAARALRTAKDGPLPAVACEALEVLGKCARIRDLAVADSLFEEALSIADAHDMTVWRARLLFHLGGHDGVRFGTTERLEQARETALRAGAVVTALDLDSELAVVHITRGEYEAAEAAALRCEETARRLRLRESCLIGLGLRVCAAAHQGQRARADALLTRFRDLGGEEVDFAAAVSGFGLAFCSLLEEDRERAWAELSRAVADEATRSAHYLSLSRGPHLMLATLAGQAGWHAHDALASSTHGQATWNRRFLFLSRALLHGRAGRAAQATQAVEQFLDVAAHQPLARHLGLRLVAEAAIDDGWGEPATWLRDAEAYFHTARTPGVAAACRALLRRAGARVPQRRQGCADVPAPLRTIGVTVREYEVLQLVIDRIANRAIGQRLFLSPRTVEKHVASLLAKTGQPDRVALARYGAQVLGDTPRPESG